MADREAEVLEEGLQLVLGDSTSVEALVQQDPERWARHATALYLAVELHRAWDTAPRPEFKAAARYRFLRAADRPRPRPWTLRLPAFVLRPALAALLIVVLGSYGVVTASASSLPGDPLYIVKVGVERAQLLMAADPHARADLQLQFVERRLREIESLNSQGRPVPPQPLEALARQTLVAAEQVSEEAPELVSQLVTVALRQQAVLNRVEQTVAEPARAALEHAEEASRRGLARAEAVIQRNADRQDNRGRRQAEATATERAQGPLSTPAVASTEPARDEREREDRRGPNPGRDGEQDRRGRQEPEPQQPAIAPIPPQSAPTPSNQGPGSGEDRSGPGIREEEREGDRSGPGREEDRSGPGSGSGSGQKTPRSESPTVSPPMPTADPQPAARPSPTVRPSPTRTPVATATSTSGSGGSSGPGGGSSGEGGSGSGSGSGSGGSGGGSGSGSGSGGGGSSGSGSGGSGGGSHP